MVIYSLSESLPVLLTFSYSEGARGTDSNEEYMGTEKKEIKIKKDETQRILILCLKNYFQ